MLFGEIGAEACWIVAEDYKEDWGKTLFELSTKDEERLYKELKRIHEAKLNRKVA